MLRFAFFGNFSLKGASHLAVVPYYPALALAAEWEAPAVDTFVPLCYDQTALANVQNMAVPCRAPYDTLLLPFRACRAFSIAGNKSRLWLLQSATQLRRLQTRGRSLHLNSFHYPRTVLVEWLARDLVLGSSTDSVGRFVMLSDLIAWAQWRLLQKVAIEINPCL